MSVYRFIRPLDVLFLRGNRLFGASGGDHAEALMPPWPSLFAGALRSQMLAESGIALGTFTDKTTAGGTPLRAELQEILGTPTEPGSFRVSWVSLGRLLHGRPAEILVPLPSDLVVTSDRGEAPAALEVRRMVPTPRTALGALTSSATLPAMPVLRVSQPSKPVSGYWLSGEGLREYLAGGTPPADALVHRRDLWRADPRLGIAMDRSARTAATGRLYTSDAVALGDGVGFVLGVDGCTDGLLPSKGLLRLGGDGRGAEVTPWPDETEWTAALEARIPRGSSFTLVLATPGLFPDGWLPPGVDGDSMRLRCDGLEARLASAVVPRHEVISGWDLAAHRPKPAQRAVPAGAAYYFDQVEGDPATYPGALWGLVEERLGNEWDETSTWKQRRAEGFNNVWVGRWPGGGV